MDDFENDELYDDDYYNQIEDDDDNEESIKDKYDRAKEYKEKYDKYKDKYNDFKNNRANNSAKNVGKNVGKEATKQGGKEVAKQGGKEAAKEAGKKAGEEIVKEAGKKATTEAGKKAAKEGAKIVAKEAAKKGAEGALTASGVGAPIAAAIEVADKLNQVKKKVEKKLDNKIEETTGIKNASKKKKLVPFLLILAIIMLIFIVPAMAMFAVSDTATSELTTLVRAREENNDKKLIMFTKKEIKELLNKDIEVSEDIASKLAEEGYTLEYDNNKYKSISYKNILKGYGNDLTNVFTPNDLTGAIDGMEDVLDDDTTYDSLSDDDKDVAVSMKNVKKYLMAEIDNFNNGVTWKETNLNVEYLNLQGESFTSYSDYLNKSKKVVSNGSGSLTNKTITDKNYTVKDDDNKDTLLKMPKLSEHGVNVSLDGGENKAAIKFVDMLEPYMQKWIIPYTIYIDTQDDDFVNSIMQYMYHPADVSIFKLQKLVKTTNFEYYMKCHSHLEKVKVSINLDDLGEKSLTEFAKSFINISGSVVAGSYTYGLNTSENKIGREIEGVSLEDSSLVITIKVTELDEPYEIATGVDGNPLVKKITINRKKENADSVAEVSHVESFYEILNREYKIVPINENNEPDSSTPDEEIVIDSNGIGTMKVVDVWNETVQMTDSKTTKYQVSYYTEEQMEDLGRDISRIEWYQDSYGSVSGGIDGESGSSINQTQQQYIDKFKDDALNDMNQSGVLASITLAQGILEGGSGTSSLAAKYNNHFGIKAGKSWNGSTVVLKTGEYDKSGNYYTINSAFRAYNSAAESFADHSKFLWNTKGHSTKAGGYRYRDCTEYAKSMTYTAPDGGATYNYKGAIQAIVDGGYCTDPKYVSKICNIIETYKLYEIDRQSTWDGSAPAYATASSSTGTGTSSTQSSGLGETAYSYDDMTFAYYQIEQWYAKSQGTLITNTIQRVALPEGGFSWPVETSGNDNAKKVLNLYGVNNSDGITISTGSVYSYDDDEGLYKGANVIATHSGIVKKVVPVSDAGTYAYVEIETEDGKYKTHYGNLSEITVTEGQTISKGNIIGKIGNTGSSTTGSDIYLTYKMYYNGSKVDPLQYYYIKDSSGARVDNYSDIDKTTISSGEYTFDGSRQYLAGSSEAVDGDINQGIEYYFTNSSGRTFNCYLQAQGPWKNSAYYSSTIGDIGCSVTADATILTGYGFSVTPGTFSSKGGQFIYGLIRDRIPGSHYYNYDGSRVDAKQNTTVGFASTAVKQKIVNHLASGKEAIIHVVGPRNGGASPYANREHWMAVLDIRESNGDYEVFVADPCYSFKPRGWRTLDSMLISLSDYILVAEDE